MWMVIVATLALFAFFNQVTLVSTFCTRLGNKRCIQVYNNCPSDIFPALSMQVGNKTIYDGFFLLNREQEDYYFPNNVTYLRVWARTNCYARNFVKCTTGDCGNNLHCDGVHNASLPVSMAEIWLNSPGVDKYDVTLFNGFNVPVKIVPTVTIPSHFLEPGFCDPVGACNHTLANITYCPEALRFITMDGMFGCLHPCTVFKTPEYCCTGEYASPEKCLSTPEGRGYRRIFKDACSTARVSPFDTPVRNCGEIFPFRPYYTIVFC